MRVATAAVASLRTLLAAAALAYLAAAAWLVWWVLVAAVVPTWTPVVITSGSMAPRIQTGDVVVAAAVAADQLGEGAVIVFADGSGGLLTHRITSAGDDGTYRTKGDGNAVEDTAAVSVDDVVGRGRLLVPAVGRPLVWFAEHRWAALAAWLAGSGVAWWAVTSWWRDAPPVQRADATSPPPRRPLTASEQQLIAFAWGGADR